MGHEHEPKVRNQGTTLIRRKEAEQSLAISGGAPLAALALASQAGLTEFQSLLDAIQKLLAGQLDPVVVAEQLQKGALLSTLDHLQHIFTNMLAERVGAQLKNAWGPQMQSLTQSADKLSNESICSLYDAISELKRHDVAQLNPQMLFEQITFALADAAQ